MWSQQNSILHDKGVTNELHKEHRLDNYIREICTVGKEFLPENDKHLFKTDLKEMLVKYNGYRKQWKDLVEACRLKARLNNHIYCDQILMQQYIHNK